MADTKEVMGYLGDGESSEGTLSVEAFLALYPEGVFRPEPPSKTDVDPKLISKITTGRGDAVGAYGGAVYGGGENES
jgi:hypothetical protein